MGRLRTFLARLPAFAALFAVSCASLPPAHAAGSPIEESVWTSLAPGIEYASFAWGLPRREVHALRVDLSLAEPVVTPPGRTWGEVEGRSLLDFAREFGCAAAVNATPFYPETFRRGDSLRLSGVLLVDGRLYAAPARRYAALAISREGVARVLPQAELGDLGNWRLAVGGFFELLREGRVVARKSSRQPMTVAGLAEGGRRIYLAVIEGRRPASAGASEEEAARLLLDLGAVDGLSFDGGGSSSMVIEEGGSSLRLVNRPAPGFPPVERVLATCLGFRPIAP